MVSLPKKSDSDHNMRPLAPPKKLEHDKNRARLLVSACLLGEKVRYDGQHKYDPFVVETLGRFVDWERICPEADSGMTIPRPSMHLIGDPRAPRLITRTGDDLTEKMQQFTEAKLSELESIPLCGYVCKKGSPSSGMERVKIYDEKGIAQRNGSGLFTRAFMKRFPLIPVEEEGRLHDLELRELFAERVFCRKRWLDLIKNGMSRHNLIEFHADHKYLLLAHDRQAYSNLGKLLAAAKSIGLRELFSSYEKGFMELLARPITRKKVTDVLQHMAGFFKNYLTKDEKAELQDTIHSFYASTAPLIVPLTLIRHYVRKYETKYLERQVFLSPYPAEMILRGAM